MLQTDGRTDGRAIACNAVARWKSKKLKMRDTCSTCLFRWWQNAVEALSEPFLASFLSCVYKLRPWPERPRALRPRGA